MGSTVKNAVNAVVTPVKATVSAVSTSISEGKPLVAVGDIVGIGGQQSAGKTGIGGVVKGLMLDAGAGAVGGLVSDVKGDPAGAISQGVTAYATGGGSLLTSGLAQAQSAGGSILGNMMGSSPGQLASGSGAPMISPSNSSPVYSAPRGADLTGPVLIGGAMLGAYLLIRRR